MVLSGIARSYGASVVFAVLFLAVVWAALFPAIAPSIDHHAVERHPQHGHLYPSGVSVDHTHSHEGAHAHQGGAASAPDDVIILPATNDTTGASVFNLVLLGQAAALALLAPAIFVLVRLPWRETLSLFAPGVDTPPPRPAL